jgi:hypothetical protein
MEHTHNNHTKGAAHEGQSEKWSASFHARLHKNNIEGCLAALPCNGDVALAITATTDAGISIYDVDMPNDEREQEAYCCLVATRLAADGATAAAMSCAGEVHWDTHERVVVLAVDRDGGEEAWTARVVRSKTKAPRIAAWERGRGTGNLMFMLHAGVGNLPGGGNIADRWN